MMCPRDYLNFCTYTNYLDSRGEFQAAPKEHSTGFLDDKQKFCPFGRMENGVFKRCDAAHAQGHLDPGGNFCQHGKVEDGTFKKTNVLDGEGHWHDNLQPGECLSFELPSFPPCCV